MKKSNLLKILLSIIIMGSYAHTFAGDWALSRVTSNVEFYHKVGECNGQQAVFLKIVNNNDYDVRITFNEIIADKISGSDIENSSGKKEITISSRSTMQANSCSDTDCSECVVLLSMVTPTHVVDMKEFKLANISISAIQ